MLNKLVRAQILTASAICIAALSAGLAPSAGAAVTSGQSRPVIRIGVVTPALKSVGPTTITCTATADNPHHSGHVPGTVNFTANVKCTSAVTSLHNTYTLSFNGLPDKSKSNSNAGAASLSSNLSDTCSNGSWQGSVEGTVVFPPGYVPSTGTVFDSNIQPVTC
jgi:hypothetical protein